MIPITFKDLAVELPTNLTASTCQCFGNSRGNSHTLSTLITHRLTRTLSPPGAHVVTLTLSALVTLVQLVGLELIRLLPNPTNTL